MNIEQPDFMSDEVYSAIKDEMRSQHREKTLKESILLVYEEDELDNLHKENCIRAIKLSHHGIEEVLTFEQYAKLGDDVRVNLKINPENGQMGSLTDDAVSYAKDLVNTGLISFGLKSSSNDEVVLDDPLDGVMAFVSFVRDNPEEYKKFVHGSYEGHDPNLSLSVRGGTDAEYDVTFPPVKQGHNDNLPNDCVREAFTLAVRRLHSLRENVDKKKKESWHHESSALFTERMDTLWVAEKKYIALQERALGIERKIERQVDPKTGLAGTRGEFVTLHEMGIS